MQSIHQKDVSFALMEKMGLDVVDVGHNKCGLDTRRSDGGTILINRTLCFSNFISFYIPITIV